jgi:hypothetical protein
VIEIPKRMKKFPLWKGIYPIHYTVWVVDGVPDFKQMHEVRRIDAFHRNLCHLCGERMLDGKFAFIGGPECVKLHAFIDGPMHEDCAAYAAAVCPFLKNANGHYSKATGGGSRPGKMFFCVTDRYTTRRNSHKLKYVSGAALAVNPMQPNQMVAIAGDWLSVTEIATDG